VTAAVFGWVKTLIALALVGNVLDWILPEGGIRRYAGLVVGLVLLGAMVGPAWSLFSGVRRTAVGALGSQGTPAIRAALKREQDADVAIVLESLPGVIKASVDQSGHLVTVRLTVARDAPGSIRAAALNTVGEVMGVGPRSVRVVERTAALASPRRTKERGGR